MNKKYFLFDLDGTLTDPKEGITKCVQYALASFGITEPDLDNLVRFIGPPLVDSFHDFYGMNEEDSLKALEKYRERFGTEGVFENSAYEGIHDILYKLKQNKKILAISTSKPEVYTHMILDKYNLREYFDVVCGSELDGTRNNKNEVIEETLVRIGKYLQPEGFSESELLAARTEAIMIGDRKHDILGAKKCMVESIGVRYGYAEPQELEEAGADYIAVTLEELEKMLLVD